MRLHAIEIEAFGPFAEPVQLDLESLSEAGLFRFGGRLAGTGVVAFMVDIPPDRRSDQSEPRSLRRNGAY